MSTLSSHSYFAKNKEVLFSVGLCIWSMVYFLLEFPLKWRPGFPESWYMVWGGQSNRECKMTSWADVSARLWCSTYVVLCWNTVPTWRIFGKWENLERWNFIWYIDLHYLCHTHFRAWLNIMIFISVLHSFNIHILQANNVLDMGVTIVCSTGKWVNYVHS